MLDLIIQIETKVKGGNILSAKEMHEAEMLLDQEVCTILYISPQETKLDVEYQEEAQDVILTFEEENIVPTVNRKVVEWNVVSYAALLKTKSNLEKIEDEIPTGLQYTRKGMEKRVLKERRTKADKAEYKIKFADNIYGEHKLFNERGIEYKITLRDFENETGYIDSVDLKTNKLGTTKHIMYAFEKLKSDKKLFKKLKKQYPFVEIYLDPLNSYQITWHFPHKLDSKTSTLLNTFFGDKKFIPEAKTRNFLKFIFQSKPFENIVIRPEVLEKIEKIFNAESLREIEKNAVLDFSIINATLFPYQKEGVEFCVFKEGAIIADEMGLGKTIQAITIALMKKQIFDFKRTIVICPASLKSQWKNEIEKFSDATATVVEGKPKERVDIYRNSTSDFLIMNYELVLRDSQMINLFDTDFIILDEAQRIKNYTTKTASALKSLNKKHSLIITGTPIENRLIDLYSVVQFIDPQFLAPLWEFSYQHCLFDSVASNRITGYYNLKELKDRMKSILIRREKRNVLKQLPQVSQVTIPIPMHPRQDEYHASYARGIAKILHKKFRTPFDMQKLMLLLTNMRMVCNSTYLIDKETNISPKLTELKIILLDKLDLANNKRKIIIFSEWINCHKIISELLRELNIGYTELSGKVPVKKRKKLIEEFETNEDCQIFLSTEAGGAGLNLQMADTVINFELPWNPAKKNQRIGRIDRLGQKSTNLTVINLMTRNSIETKIATGLVLKQNLFEGVFNLDDATDKVDFSEKGRSQFLQEIESMVDEFEYNSIHTENEIIEVEEENIPEIDVLNEKEEEEVEKNNPVSVAASNEENSNSDTEKTTKKHAELEQVETVMNKGLEFLAGLYKMSTGQDMNTNDQKVEIDKETGEVVMRFKLKL